MYVVRDIVFELIDDVCCVCVNVVLNICRVIWSARGRFRESRRGVAR